MSCFRVSAEMLGKAHSILKETHPDLRLLVYDGLRPRSIQWVLWNTLSNIPESERSNFVANPRSGSIHNFGAAGVFEQDDMELWISATAAGNNPIAAQYPYSFHTSLPYLDNPVADYGWPGRAYRPQDTEVAQFAFMKFWDEQICSTVGEASEADGQGG